jgi:hypothetical protein
MEYRPKQFELFYSGLAGTLSVRHVKDALFLSKESEDLYFDVIEIAAVEQLKAENLELSNMYKQQIEKTYSLRVDKDAEITALKSKLKIAMQGLVDVPNHVCGCCEDSRESVIKHCLAVGKEIEKICGEI